MTNGADATPGSQKLLNLTVTMAPIESMMSRFLQIPEERQRARVDQSMQSLVSQHSVAINENLQNRIQNELLNVFRFIVGRLSLKRILQRRHWGKLAQLEDIKDQ